jgi:Ca2+-binding EF-hand superfamily protein
MRAQVLAAALTLTIPGVAAAQTARPAIRFSEMDTNRDRVITRNEWRGSAQSFRVHDWNGDGILSGEEVRVGGRRPGIREPDYDPNNNRYFTDWTTRGFRLLDRNRDNRVTGNEWFFDRESFYRADRNRDGVLTQAEFLGQRADDDRDDRFDYIDVNNNGRIERGEWHGLAETFHWLDRNNDGIVTRAEVGLQPANQAGRDMFRSLDSNRNNQIDLNEWLWSRWSFNARDDNRNGVLDRREFLEEQPIGTSGSNRTVVVPAIERWVDTGIFVQRGNTVMLDAAGRVVLSSDPSDTASPQGSDKGRRANDAPLRDQPAGGLIGRIGESEPIYLGSSRSVQAPASGRLYLSVNDDHLPDNRGEFRVNVRVQRGAGN